MKNEKSVLKGQEYAAPRTESVEITNQGVLCASGAPAGGVSTTSYGTVRF